MENFGTIPPPPPPPPRQQLLRLRKQQPLLPEPLPLRPRAIPWLTAHDVKKGKSYDKMREYVENVRQQNEDSERVLLPKSISYQDQNLENHQDTRSEPGINEVVEGSESESRNTRCDWVISIKDKLEQTYREDDRTSRGKLCIYKVPHYILGNNKKSYFPQTVSLGPYHHGCLDLMPMEHHKWRAVNKVLARARNPIEMYLDAMKELEQKARACYQGLIAMSSYNFVEMLVLDGCFALEIFRGAYEGFLELGYDRNDPVFVMRGLMQSIQHDMILLENQLPLFVLNRLLELQLGTQKHTDTVAQLAVRFFHTLIPTDEPSTHTLNSLKRDNFFNLFAGEGDSHCLDVFRRYLLRPCSKDSNPERRSSNRRGNLGPSMLDQRQKQMIYCVRDLKDAGINFRMRETDRFWDIRFNKGYLEIPKLAVHDGTKSLFLNLIAFEQRHIDSSNDITSYIVFMDNLIYSNEDVSHLRSCGIIKHWLESDSEVADLFNRLGRDITFNISDSYLGELSKEACRYYFHHHKYYRIWNGWKKTLKEKYFDSPWGYISFVAAIMLMILTLAQCYFAAYAYYKTPY